SSGSSPASASQYAALTPSSPPPMTTTSAFPGSHPDRACQKDTESEGDAGDDTISGTSPLNDPAALTVLSYHFAIASPRPFRHAPEHSSRRRRCWTKTRYRRYVITHWLLVLLFGVHRPTAEP